MKRKVCVTGIMALALSGCDSGPEIEVNFRYPVGDRTAAAEQIRQQLHEMGDILYRMDWSDDRRLDIQLTPAHDDDVEISAEQANTVAEALDKAFLQSPPSTPPGMEFTITSEEERAAAHGFETGQTIIMPLDWHEASVDVYFQDLSLPSNLMTTALDQDSILRSYYCGVEVPQRQFAPEVADFLLRKDLLAFDGKSYGIEEGWFHGIQLDRSDVTFLYGDLDPATLNSIEAMSDSFNPNLFTEDDCRNLLEEATQTSLGGLVASRIAAEDNVESLKVQM